MKGVSPWIGQAPDFKTGVVREEDNDILTP